MYEANSYKAYCNFMGTPYVPIWSETTVPPSLMSYIGRREEHEMKSRIDVGDIGSEGSVVVEVPRGTSTTTRPDPDVPARAKLRRLLTPAMR